MNRQPDMPTRLFILAVCAAAAWAIELPAAQVPEELVFKNGTRIPLSGVKVTPEGFSATRTVGNTTQTANFTAKDVVRGTFREPALLSSARVLTATGKADQAATELAKLCTDLAPYQTIQGSWWHRAVILRMDALSAQGKTHEALALVPQETIETLPKEAAELVSDFKKILTKETAPAEPAPTQEAEKTEPPDKPATTEKDVPGTDKAPAEKPAAPEKTAPKKTEPVATGKIAELQTLAKTSTDTWLTARAWLEIGYVQSSSGKIEEAVKAWLRVFVFYGAETDLAARGLIEAARGLQQLKLADQGVKLLDDYHTDHIGSPYSSAITAEIKKLDPKQAQ